MGGRRGWSTSSLLRGVGEGFVSRREEEKGRKKEEKRKEGGGPLPVSVCLETA